MSGFICQGGRIADNMSIFLSNIVPDWCPQFLKRGMLLPVLRCIYPSSYVIMFKNLSQWFFGMNVAKHYA